MSQLVNKIRTSSGDLQIDYNALANLPTISNPNLLINSDFRNPVNQRGKTSYVGTNEQAVYTIDRWKTKCLTVTVNDASITLTNNTNAAWGFSQNFENNLPEDMYTVSLKILSVTGSPYVRCGKNDGTNTYALNLTSTGVLVTNAYGAINSLVIAVPAGGSIELEWIKLEQGHVATSFVPKHRAEELMNCYRFFYAQDSRLLMNQYSAQYADGNIYYPIRMRAVPKVTLLEGTYFSSSQSAFVAPASLVVNSSNFSECNVTLKMEKNEKDTFSPGMSLNADIQICLDAEIY